MIIDVHSHTPQFRDGVPAEYRRTNGVWRPDREVEAVYDWNMFMAAQAPADKTIVFPVAWAPGERTGGVNGFNEPGDVADNPNDSTAMFVRAYPERLIGFMSLHPHDPLALGELERSRTDLGLRGIKLGANYQSFDPLESRALAIYREAERHGLPILFHIGTSGVRTAPINYAHPLIIDEIAMRYPELRIIMAHMGHPWTVDSVVVIRKHPHVYADISGLIYRKHTLYQALLQATEWNVMHKLLFGSDYPIVTPAETAAGLRSVNDIVEGTKFPTISQEAIEGIIHRDSLPLLGLA